MVDLSPGTLALLFLTVIHVPTATFVFCRRRQKFPISGHSIPLVLISQVSLFLHTVFNLLAGYATPCWIFLLLAWLVFLAVNAFLCRALRIWFFYLLASERVDSAGLECHTKRWFAEHAHYFSERNFVAAAFGFGTFKFVISAIPFLLSPDWSEMLTIDDGGAGGCPSLEMSHRVQQITLVFMLVVVLCVAYRMRNVHDGFSIKTEMKICVVLCFFMVLLLAGHGRVLSSDTYKILWALSSNAITLVTCTWKVVLSTLDTRHSKRAKHTRHGAGDWSRKWAQARGSESSTAAMAPAPLEEFNYVYGNKRLLREFTEHLKREFSVENLLFCQAADEFMEECDCNKLESPDERNKRALAIYLEFIDEHSPSEINICANTRDAIAVELARCVTNFDRKTATKKILDDLESDELLPATIFSGARMEVYVLMERDTFRRFKSHREQLRPKLVQAFEGV